MNRLRYNEEYEPQPLDSFERLVSAQVVVGERQSDVVEFDESDSVLANEEYPE